MKALKKQIIMSCLFIAVSWGVTQAQDFTVPIFSPTSTVVDFGEVNSKTDVGYRVLTFTNTGASPLTITHIQPSCGCTVPEWPKEPIQPGKSSQIKIKYDITRIGTISKTITVTTNEPDGKDADANVIFKQHVITIKGNVK
jgi:hypothetical protein